MTNLISVRHVTKKYSDRAVLDDISLDVPSGQVVGFVGVNGAGKTTTIRAILGLCALNTGEVILFGEPFSSTSNSDTAQRIKSNIGVVFDTCPFVTELPIKTIAAIMRNSYPEWDDHAFKTLLTQFGLTLNQKIKSLSRGMGMKLQVACALAHRPQLLIMDEATAGLDPMAREEVLDILRAYLAEDENRAVLLSSHITSDLEKIADRIVCIDSGRIIFDLEKDEITDMSGIVKCRSNEFEEIMSSDFIQATLATTKEGIRYTNHGYGIDFLVPDRFAFTKHFPEIVCERATIEGYMQLMLKGEIR